MKHQRLSTYEIAKPLPPRGVPLDLRKILVYAHFSPHQNPNLDAINLVSYAVQNNLNVTSAAGGASDIAQHKISFLTPHKFETSFAKIAQDMDTYSHIIIYLNSIIEPELNGDHPWKRIKERRRMTRMIHQFAKLDTHLIFVGTPRQRLFFMKTMMFWKSHANIRFVSSAFDTPEIGALKNPNLAHNDVLDQYNRHANFEFEPGPLRAKSILQHLRGIDNATDELATLCRLALSPQIKQHDLIHRIKNRFWPMEQNNASREKSSPLTIANETSPYPDITRYMLHLHQVYHLNARYNLHIPKDRDAFLHWYQTKAHLQVPSKWVPQTCTSPSPSSHDRINFFNDPFCDAICAYFDMETPFAQLPLRLRMLLETKKHSNGPSGFMIFMAILCGAYSKSHGAEMLWRDVRIVQWFDSQVRPVAPHFQSQPGPTKAKITHKLLLCGIQDEKSGIAKNFKMTHNALNDLGLDFEISATTTPHITQKVSDMATIRPKRNVMIHHVNADRVPLHLISPMLARRRDIYHIGFPLWELSKAPDLHRLGIDCLDEIWAPSHFVAQIYANMGAPNIQMVGKSIPQLDFLDVLSNTQRSEDGAFTCLTAFDFHSSVECKNPIAAVYAFQKAFPRSTHPHCKLIVKTTPVQSNHWGDPHDQIGQIRRIAHLDSRIKLCEPYMKQSDYFRLLASADCIISPHRGEGFGYLAAYALALSKPLIVTNFGGTRDFCTYENSFPIVSPLVDVPRSHAIYPTPNAKWADISPDAMSKALRQIHEQYDQAVARARIGQQFIQSRYSNVNYCKNIATRLRAIGVI